MKRASKEGAAEGPGTSVGVRRGREEEQEVYRRCKAARQTDLRTMLAKPRSKENGESGEIDNG